MLGTGWTREDYQLHGAKGGDHRRRLHGSVAPGAEPRRSGASARLSVLGSYLVGKASSKLFSKSGVAGPL
jgi:hypothetical protein